MALNGCCKIENTICPGLRMRTRYKNKPSLTNAYLVCCRSEYLIRKINDFDYVCLNKVWWFEIKWLVGWLVDNAYSKQHNSIKCNSLHQFNLLLREFVLSDYWFRYYYYHHPTCLTTLLNKSTWCHVFHRLIFIQIFSYVDSLEHYYYSIIFKNRFFNLCTRTFKCYEHLRKIHATFATFEYLDKFFAETNEHTFDAF